MAKIVDEYSISLGPSEAFPTVLITLKLDDGSVHGPFEFVPPFAHQLSDELCVAAARSAKRVTGGESRGGAFTHDTKQDVKDPSEGA